MRNPIVLPLMGIRFLLSFRILSYHYLEPALGKTQAPAWLPWVTGLTYWGIPLFFVLSGFSLAYAYEHEEFGKPGVNRRFWINRVARIYPMYMLAFLLLIPVIAVAVAIGHEATASVRDYLIGMVTYTFLLQAYGPDSWSVWNGPAWSISTDVAFYVVFPLLAVALARRRLGYVMAASLGFPLTVLAVSLARPDLTPDLTTLYHQPLFHLPLFLTGMMVAKHRARFAGWVHRRPGLVALAAVAWVVVAGAILLPLEQHRLYLAPVIATYAVLPASAGLLAACMAPSGAVLRVLGNPAMVWLGNLSYGIFILQNFVSKVVFYPAEVFFGLEVRRTLLGFVLLVLVLLPFSWVVHRWYENPMRRYVRKRLGSPPPASDLRPVEPTGETVPVPSDGPK